MQKRFSLVLIGLLIGMLVIGGSGIVGGNFEAFADNDDDNYDDDNDNNDDDDDNGAGVDSPSDQTEVYWNVTGGCWLNLSAHTNLDLGSYSQIDVGSSINSEGTAPGQKKVQVKTNCPSYDLQVKATQFDLPNNHGNDQSTAIQDFALKADQGSITSYTAFSGLDSNLLLDDNGSGPNTTNYTMDYQYTWDENDVPGSYRVHLTYTASTT
ncbi:hypothetical protein K9M06_04230 [Candidatus Bipolaricaulota bacterium]|nr:hypothetical protein [Candidatus Bipolaricaulota bacterium]